MDAERSLDDKRSAEQSWHIRKHGLDTKRITKELPFGSSGESVTILACPEHATTRRQVDNLAIRTTN